MHGQAVHRLKLCHAPAVKQLSAPFVAVLAAGLLTTACDSSRQEPTRNPPGDPPKGSAAAKFPGNLKEGQAPPDVSLKLHDGSSVKLSSLKGKHVALYFYPKDDTPGCRIEAQGFRDNHEDLTKAGIKVFAAPSNIKPIPVPGLSGSWQLGNPLHVRPALFAGDGPFRQFTLGGCADDGVWRSVHERRGSR